MFSQTIALIFISVMIAVLCAYKTNLKYGVGVLPILIVPFTYLLAFPISDILSMVLASTPYFVLRVIISIIGLSIAIIVILLISLSIKFKKFKIAYSTFLIGYCVILTIIYIKNIIASALLF